MEKNDLENAFERDSKYEYVRSLAYEYFMTEDENGPMISIAVFDLLNSIESGKSNIPFSRKNFDNQTFIQNSLKLTGLDPDKFWEAVKFIHACSEELTVEALPLERSVYDRISGFLEALKNESAEITVKIKDKKLYQSSDPLINNYLYQIIDDYCSEREVGYDPGFFGQGIALGKETKGSYNYQERIYIETRLYQYIFKVFCTDTELPTRTTTPKSPDDNPLINERKWSRNKKLLISRLMFFTGIADKESFNESDNSIKGIIKKFEGKQIDAISKRFLFTLSFN